MLDVPITSRLFLHTLKIRREAGFVLEVSERCIVFYHYLFFMVVLMYIYFVFIECHFLINVSYCYVHTLLCCFFFCLFVFISGPCDSKVQTADSNFWLIALESVLFRLYFQ